MRQAESPDQPPGGSSPDERPSRAGGAHRVILLYAAAPPKPAPGATCNGCGLCCAVQPCPLGMLLSRRRHGACAALSWDEQGRSYRCGALADPGRWLPWLPERWAVALSRRWIAAGVGCDASVTIDSANSEA